MHGWILTHLSTTQFESWPKLNDFSFDRRKKMGRVEDYHPYRRAKNSALMTFPLRGDRGMGCMTPRVLYHLVSLISPSSSPLSF